MVTISDGSSSAQISPVGAELQSWIVGGQELVWQRDPAFWKKSAPVLFPVVGWCNNGEILIGETHYPMPVHGFASTQTFSFVQQSESKIAFSLKVTSETRKHFPFAFGLEITFQIKGDGLTTTMAVSNPGPNSLPYSIGHHPAFVLDAKSGSRPKYRIEFVSAETGKLPCISPKGLFTEQTRAVDLEDGRILRLDDAVFADDALCFLDANSDSLRLVSENGSAIRVDVENLPHFAIWSKQGAPFVSVECWSGHGDPEDYAGDIVNKPSISVLNPSAVGTHTIRYSFEGA